ncbi:septation protein SepH [Brachybacterium hainanense]|uniref:Septation protein SepH n=1 Tax=Brachybacterium hainanense TaxID=1541174 RepID=A0ABV6RFM1_9MICO
MRELELDGIHDDDEHVILTDSDGTRYTLRIDEALRAAVRRDRPALGAIRATEATPLRPRDIQTMLRQGRSAEEIAEIAKVSLDHVRRYEGPVLAEREYTAQRCRRFPAGRGDGPTLEELVSERLAARRAGDDVRWDAWRRTDGTWALELAFSAGGRERSAHWVADLERRSVTPEDDEARWLLDEDAEPSGPMAGRARLTAIKRSVYDIEADGEFDERAPRSRPRPLSWHPREGAPSGSDPRSAHPAGIGADELDALNARRGLRSVPSPSLPSPAAEEPVWESLDEPAPHGADAEASREHAEQRQEDALLPADDASAEDLPREAGTPDRDGAQPDAPSPEDAGDEPDQPDGDAHGASPADPARHDPAQNDTVELSPLPGLGEPSTPRRTAPKKKSGSKRSSIPSWDEIVFGSKHE